MKSELTPSQLRVLGVVLSLPAPMTLREVARVDQTLPHNVYQLLLKLRRDGLVDFESGFGNRGCKARTIRPRCRFVPAGDIA